MNSFRTFFVLVLIASPVCLADSPNGRLPTLGVYIVDDAGTDLLGTVIPVLYSRKFADMHQRDISREQLPISIFKNSQGDEIDLVRGHHCMLLEFTAAAATHGGEDPNVVIGRFTAVHEELQRHFAALPEPRPRIVMESPVPPGCPTMF